MTPSGEVGREGIRAYATRDGLTEDEYLARLGEPLTPELTGAALVELTRADPATIAAGYLLTSSGLKGGATSVTTKQSARTGTHNPWLAVVVVGTVMYLTTLELFVVNVAITAIGQDFTTANPADLSWILTCTRSCSPPPSSRRVGLVTATAAGECSSSA